MLEMTIQVPEPLAAELMAKSGRLPEVLAYGITMLKARALPYLTPEN